MEKLESLVLSKLSDRNAYKRKSMEFGNIILENLDLY